MVWKASSLFPPVFKQSLFLSSRIVPFISAILFLIILCVLQALKGNHGVILDSCIPTHGVAQWMEKSNCLLLKEKAAYRELYEAVCLVS